MRGHLRKHDTVCTCDCSLQSKHSTCSKWPPQLGFWECSSHLGDQKTVKWLYWGHLTFLEWLMWLGKTLSKFYNDWLLWTVTIIMVSHRALWRKIHLNIEQLSYEPFPYWTEHPDTASLETSSSLHTWSGSHISNAMFTCWKCEGHVTSLHSNSSMAYDDIWGHNHHREHKQH